MQTHLYEEKKKNEWWEVVDNATWQLNCKMLLESCKNRGKVRTKTLRISDFVESGQYEYKRPRNPSLNFQEKLLELLLWHGAECWSVPTSILGSMSRNCVKIVKS